MTMFKSQLRFLGLCILTHFRLAVAQRTTFFLTVFVTVLKQVLFLMSWRFFFGKYQTVLGWNFNDMLVMYGTVCFSIGFFEAFFYGLKDLPRMIENGQLDTFLLQPKNVVFNIALSKGDMAAFGEILTGIILISASGYLISSPIPVLLVLLLSIVFVFALAIYLNSIAFFMPNSHDFIRELNLNVAIMASQPNVAYRGALKLITFTILPVAFLSYLPIEYLRTELWENLGWAALGTAIFTVLAYWIFSKGLKRYESGNIIAQRF